MSDIHALEILVIALACGMATFVYTTLSYRRMFKQAVQRLALLTDFMQYWEREKHRLPKDVRFNYEQVWKQSMNLLIKQSKGRKNGKVQGNNNRK